MWCWHRIRESESGLCPACRTPYGDDPHEFSAVDVEEVLKANKEKEAAAKREKQRQQSDGNSSDGEGVGSIGGMKGQMEVPRDRTQLANMRVIRRNLVYAVGLPPTIASEDTLRKPDYFGQYGKISKIVLNRSQSTGGDLRRASASAYVTFVFKVCTYFRCCVISNYFSSKGPFSL
jgi:CCR4-NOT transcription complex subunit 4